MLLKEGPVNASTIHSQKGAGPVSRLAQGVLGIVVFPQSISHTNDAYGLSYVCTAVIHWTLCRFTGVINIYRLK